MHYYHTLGLHWGLEVVYFTTTNREGVDANGDRSIVSTVKRLCAPWWYTTVRTIISPILGFGSPEMARKLYDLGLRSIMQVAKSAYWPREMPINDIVQALGPEYGDVRSMVSPNARDPFYVVTCRDLKCSNALVATCSTTMPGGWRYFREPNTNRIFQVMYST